MVKFRSDGSAATIYVVDDDEAMRDSLRWLLESSGYRVETYASAEGFLATCRHATAICLVLDVHMRGLTGLEVQHELNRRGTPTPIIFVTGPGHMSMVLDALDNGPFHVLEKPFSSERLLELIERLASSGTQVEAEQARPGSAAADFHADAVE